MLYPLSYEAAYERVVEEPVVVSVEHGLASPPTCPSDQSHQSSESATVRLRAPKRQDGRSGHRALGHRRCDELLADRAGAEAGEGAWCAGDQPGVSAVSRRLGAIAREASNATAASLRTRCPASEDRSCVPLPLQTQLARNHPSPAVTSSSSCPPNSSSGPSRIVATSREIASWSNMTSCPRRRPQHPRSS